MRAKALSRVGVLLSKLLTAGSYFLDLPWLLMRLSCRLLLIRLVETEIRCIFASEIFRESSQEVNGSVAQLNRASDYGSEGYRFESCRSHKRISQSNLRDPFFVPRSLWVSFLSLS